MIEPGDVLRPAATIGASLAAALTAHTAWNLTRLRRPPGDPSPVTESVSVLLPVRDEAHRLTPCLRSLLGQLRVEDLEVLVLDDGSSDGSADVAYAVGNGDARLRTLTGVPPPEGWLGKPHACAQLAAAARGSVLVFVDADVVLAPHAVASSVAVLRDSGLDLVSPYPRQLADGLGPRLVQPLLQWSWLTMLPLGLAELSPRPALAAANGQFLLIDAGAYRRAGGHGAVRADVLEDVALLRAVKSSDGRGVVVDGTQLATCRMYAGWPDLRAGYTKSLWAAFGSPAGAAAVMTFLALAYVMPPVAALLTRSRAGALGYALAVGGRALVARRTGQRMWPDVLAHPASVAVLGWLTATSWRERRAGSLTWKGRALP